jgi:hypothetical protein
MCKNVEKRVDGDSAGCQSAGQMKTTTNEIKSTRRFLRDERHPYGRKVTFKTTLTDGINRRRVTLFDIGVDRWSAINNALRAIPVYIRDGKLYVPTEGSKIGGAP